MIKDISKLSEKSFKFQKEFLQNCNVYEKIEAFYIRVKVLNKNTLKFYKANNKEIDTVDIILNKMWQMPITDFTEIFFSNEDFVQKSIGMTFSFFFFPVSDPLGLNYSHNSRLIMNYRYILDNIKMPDGRNIKAGYLTQFKDLDKEHLIRENGIHLGKINITTKEIKDFLKDTNSQKYLNLFLKRDGVFTNESNLCVKDKLDVSGFIFKYNNDVYQYQNDNPYRVFKTRDVISDNRLALELFTHSFAKFLNQVDYMDFISSNDYIKNICTLVLKYKTWLETDDNQNIYKYYNISAKDLTAPTFGYYGGTHYDLIPNQKLRDLCVFDVFWNNIFKILLNGLRKEKKNTHPTLVMNDNDIDTWNTLVKLLSGNDTKVFKSLK